MYVLSPISVRDTLRNASADMVTYCCSIYVLWNNFENVS